MYRVAILDDHELFRQGLACLLRSQAWTAVETFDEDVEAFRLACREQPFDCVILDLNLGSHDGVEFCWQLKQGSPQVRVLGISHAGADEVILRLIASGADGFISKASGIGDVVAALQAMRLGRLHFPTNLLSRAVRGADAGPQLPGDIESLTDRERQILVMIVEDELSNPQIASKLYVSPRTVETHKRNICLKLGVKSVIGLAKVFLAQVAER